jgi:hypothetical protein
MEMKRGITEEIKKRINYVLYLMHIETPVGWGDFYT